jgi:hypothetical protein
MGKVRMAMKLYFYILDRDRKTDGWNLRLEECEVTEKAKTYRPVTKFPDEIYTSFIRKESIGNFINEHSKVVVLDAPDYEKAKEVFFKKYDNELNTLRKRINFYEELKAAIENYKEDAKC